MSDSWAVDIRRSHGSGNQARCWRDDHDLWREIMNARLAAHKKHGANSIEAIAPDSPRWVAILGEEFGEVCHALTYDGPKEDLRSELIDLLAVASAYVSAIDAEGEKHV